MDMQVRLTQFSHGGGCGCKIAPGVLEQILARTAPGLIPRELLVGIETSDDAAVYRLNDTQAIVATTDFFMPIVDDPFDFGAIAATNAISDVYAMGGQPLFALALVGMPVNQIPLDVIRKILEGGESVCARAGIPIAGGHTIDSVEPIYGLVAIGLVDPRHLKRNSGARPGIATGASARNGTGYGSRIELGPAIADAEKALLTDPQTSGGLLVACAPSACDAVMEIFRSEGFGAAAIVGDIVAGEPKVRVE